MESTSGKPRRAEDLVWRKIDGEIVILTEDGRKIHTLNSVGSAIWEMADGSKDLSEIAEEVCERFEVTRKEAESDITEFCTEMTAKNILQMSS